MGGLCLATHANRSTASPRKNQRRAGKVRSGVIERFQDTIHHRNYGLRGDFRLLANAIELHRDFCAAQRHQFGKYAYDADANGN